MRALQDVAALSIEASDLQADPAHKGLLILSATIRNRAPIRWHTPIIELTLSDTQDQPVVRRAFAPGEYISGAADPDGRHRRQHRAAGQALYRCQRDDAGRLPGVFVLSLNPGQAGLAPAAELAALSVRILVALESFQDVERLRIACRRGHASRAVGTLSAAAKKEHRRVDVSGALIRSSFEKFRIAPAVGIDVPLQKRAVRNMADVIPFRAGANVD